MHAIARCLRPLKISAPPLSVPSAQVEEHVVDGRQRTLLVHRKASAAAWGAGRPCVRASS